MQLKEKDGGDGIKRPLDARLRAESHRLDAWRFQSLRNGLNQRGRRASMRSFSEDDGLIGVAIVGNPVSASLMDGFTAEVLRLCVRPNTPKNACSMLYGACWRAWRAMGGKRLVTYTLATESGDSLRGAGWKIVAEVKPHNGWNRLNIERVREWNPIYGQKKFRWEAARIDSSPA